MNFVGNFQIKVILILNLIFQNNSKNYLEAHFFEQYLTFSQFKSPFFSPGKRFIANWTSFFG